MQSLGKEGAKSAAAARPCLHASLHLGVAGKETCSRSPFYPECLSRCVRCLPDPEAQTQAVRLVAGSLTHRVISPALCCHSGVGQSLSELT